MNKVSIDVELADTEAKRVLGLMHRPKLPEGKGMLFVFDNEGNHSFWNKNVNFDLSLGFFDSEGRLLSIKNMAAQNPTPVSSGESNIKYVLEVNQGFFSKNGISLGAKLSNLKRIFKKEEKRTATNNFNFKESYSFEYSVEIK